MNKSKVQYTTLLFLCLSMMLATLDLLLYNKTCVQDEVLSRLVDRYTDKLSALYILDEPDIFADLVQLSYSLHFAKQQYGKYPKYGMLRIDPDSSYWDQDRDKSVDIWGNPYYLNEYVMLYSAGPDKEFGTKDDIGVNVEADIIHQKSLARLQELNENMYRMLRDVAESVL